MPLRWAYSSTSRLDSPAPNRSSAGNGRPRATWSPTPRLRLDASGRCRLPWNGLTGKPVTTTGPLVARPMHGFHCHRRDLPGCFLLRASWLFGLVRWPVRSQECACRCCRAARSLEERQGQRVFWISCLQMRPHANWLPNSASAGPPARANDAARGDSPLPALALRTGLRDGWVRIWISDGFSTHKGPVEPAQRARHTCVTTFLSVRINLAKSGDTTKPTRARS